MPSTFEYSWEKTEISYIYIYIMQNFIYDYICTFFFQEKKFKMLHGNSKSISGNKYNLFEGF